MIKKLVLAGVLSSASMLAHAEIYVGLQHVTVTYTDQDTADVNFRPNALMLRFGHALSDNMAIEFRSAVGLNDDSQFSAFDAVPASNGVAAKPNGFDTYTASMTASYGLYAKFFTTFGDTVLAKPYISLGYGATEIEVTNLSRKVDDPNSSDPLVLIDTPVVNSGLDETGMQLAAGVDLQMTEMFALNVEYLSLYDDKDDQVRGLSVGFSLFF